MVTVTYPVSDTYVYYHCTIDTTGFAPVEPNLYYYNPSTTKTITFDVGELLQGSPFDEFHNKSVSHRKLDLHLNFVTNPMGVSTRIEKTDTGERCIKSIFKKTKEVIKFSWMPGKACIYNTDDTLLFKHQDDEHATKVTYEVLYCGKSDVSSYAAKFRYRRIISNPSFNTTTQTSTYYTNHRFLASACSLAEVMNRAREILLNIRYQDLPIEQKNYDKCVKQLWNSVDYLDVNNIENLLSLKEFKAQIPPILSLIKKRNIKSVSDLYLWYKYTYKTTESDARECIKYLNKRLNRARYRYSKASSSTSKYVVKASTYTQTTLRVHAYFSVQRSLMKQLGIDINCSNLWDIIPFSFVVDWFVNIGDVLESLDKGADLLNVNMQSLYQSRKTISRGQVYLKTEGGFYNYTYTHYVREKLDYLPVSVPSFALKNPFIHFVDGAALAISCRR